MHLQRTSEHLSLKAVTVCCLTGILVIFAWRCASLHMQSRMTACLWPPVGVAELAAPLFEALSGTLVAPSDYCVPTGGVVLLLTLAGWFNCCAHLNAVHNKVTPYFSSSWQQVSLIPALLHYNRSFHLDGLQCINHCIWCSNLSILLQLFFLPWSTFFIFKP